MYKTITEIEGALRDRSYAERVMTKVSKGPKGTFNYVPWNESVALLNDIFGVFGWSAVVVGGHSDTERGIYRTDLTLTVRARDDESGETVEVSRPGTGGSQIQPLSHEDSMKASRSDALSVAVKSLGDAFGLFLYDKGDPARSEASSNSFTPSAATNRPNTQVDTARPTAANSERPVAPSNDRRPSEKQMGVLAKAGYPQSQVDGMPFAQWKAVIDAIFAKTTPPVAPAGAAAAKPAPTPKPVAQVVEDLDFDANIPF